MPKGSPGVKKGPRAGSRPWMLLRLRDGKRAFLEAPKGRLQAFMQQVAADIHRNGLKGLVTQSAVFGVLPNTRELIELVMVERRESLTT